MKTFTTYLLIIVFLFISPSLLAQTPKLSSHPGASATLFFDFDGHTVQSAGWRNGMRFICEPSGMTAAQITEIFHRVAEDYRPFDVNITTDSTVFLSAPLAQRVRMIVTQTSSWYPGVGGIAYVGSFTWGDDTPGFIFPDRLGNIAKYVAECCTHESGHTIGLSHQAVYNDDCALINAYNPGVGSGEVGWAPVMGNSYYKNMTGWNNGPTPYGCNNVQDNLTIITSMNGFGYRADDYEDVLSASTFNLGAENFTAQGIITTSTDKDAFRFQVTDQSAYHIDVIPFGLNASNTGANLDVKMLLYDGSKNLIRTYDPNQSLQVSIDTTLLPGEYYMVVKGTGNVYADEYGSLGSYTINGFAVKVLTIQDVNLQGNSFNKKHNLQWSITADEPIETQTLEVSRDGIHFATVETLSNATRNFSYSPTLQGNLLYRLHVISGTGHQVYSNVIALQSDAPGKGFIVGNVVRHDIRVQASDKFQYQIFDVNGKLLNKGQGQAGIENIQVSNLTSGIYFIQLISNNHKQTERILKQ